MNGEDLELFFSMSLDMLCVCSSDGYFVRVNPAFNRVLGHSDEALLSRPYADFVHPDDRESTREATCDIAGGRRIDYFENRYLCADGSYRWIAWTASAAAAKDGLFYAVARDVTDQKAQAEAREDLLKRLQASLEQIKSLEGLLPVCAWCHRIRDEEGGWDEVERYIEKHTRAEFTHSICPDCQNRNFPE
jgi:PAS domain S-box-containing protein